MKYFQLRMMISSTCLKLQPLSPHIPQHQAMAEEKAFSQSWCGRHTRRMLLPWVQTQRKRDGSPDGTRQIDGLKAGVDAFSCMQARDKVTGMYITCLGRRIILLCLQLEHMEMSWFWWKEEVKIWYLIVLIVRSLCARWHHQNLALMLLIIIVILFNNFYSIFMHVTSVFGLKNPINLNPKVHYDSPLDRFSILIPIFVPLQYPRFTYSKTWIN